MFVANIYWLWVWYLLSHRNRDTYNHLHSNSLIITLFEIWLIKMIGLTVFYGVFVPLFMFILYLVYLRLQKPLEYRLISSHVPSITKTLWSELIFSWQLAKLHPKGILLHFLREWYSTTILGYQWLNSSWHKFERFQPPLSSFPEQRKSCEILSRLRWSLKKYWKVAFPFLLNTCLLNVMPTIKIFGTGKRTSVLHKIR